MLVQVTHNIKDTIYPMEVDIYPPPPIYPMEVIAMDPNKAGGVFRGDLI